MPSDSKASDIAILGAKILDKVCDAPVLNVMKPLAGVLMLICETVAASTQIHSI